MAYDEEIAEQIRELFPEDVDYVEKPMFGGLAFLVGGHMSVCASSRGGILARFDPERTDEYRQEPHTDPFVMREREMDGWLRVQPADREELARWVDRGVTYAASLPPKG